MTEEGFKQKKGQFRKQLIDSFYFGLPGIAIIIYAIQNILEMNREKYFYESYSVPKILGWFFDKFGPLATTILMMIIGLGLLSYCVVRIVAYRKNMSQLKNEYATQTS